MQMWINEGLTSEEGLQPSERGSTVIALEKFQVWGWLWDLMVCLAGNRLCSPSSPVWRKLALTELLHGEIVYFCPYFWPTQMCLSISSADSRGAFGWCPGGEVPPEPWGLWHCVSTRNPCPKTSGPSAEPAGRAEAFHFPISQPQPCIVPCPILPASPRGAPPSAANLQRSREPKLLISVTPI